MGGDECEVLGQAIVQIPRNALTFRECGRPRGKASCLEFPPQRRERDETEARPQQHVRDQAVVIADDATKLQWRCRGHDHHPGRDEESCVVMLAGRITCKTDRRD